MADIALRENETLFFNSPTFNLRVLMINDEPWFVASEVCAALDIANPRDALARLDEDEKGVGSIDTPGGWQQVNIINESGLYSLILGSRKPEAKKLKKWVTSEVLPGIRRVGFYGTPPALVSDKVVDGLIAQTKEFGTALSEQNRRVALLSQRILASEPQWAEIARYRSLGLTVDEIARLQCCHPHTVERRITAIKAAGIELPRRGSALKVAAHG